MVKAHINIIKSLNVGEMSPMLIMAKCPMTKCPLAKCPLAKCPLAKCPGFVKHRVSFVNADILI